MAHPSLGGPEFQVTKGPSALAEMKQRDRAPETLAPKGRRSHHPQVKAAARPADSQDWDRAQCRGAWVLEDEFEQAPGVGNAQGSLVCCSPWGLKESETSERLN